MRFRYSEWTEEDEKQSGKLGLQDLINLFSQLLLQTNGDVGEALQWMNFLDRKYNFTQGEGLGQFIEYLEKEGYIRQDESGQVYYLTSKGGRRIREDSLKQIFTSLKKSPFGGHDTPFLGSGTERLSETKPYQFGDSPTDLDFSSTINNAIKRDGYEDFNIKEEDLEVYDTEHLTSCSTVIMLDISHSMVLYGEDRITPAKRASLALAELILTKFPKDQLNIIVFGDDAKEIKLEDLPYANVGPYHTNTKAGLQLARRILMKSKNANKQVFMVTDGKPSAIFDEGRLYKNPFGLDRRIVAQTLNEAMLCRRNKIVITTFMVTEDPYLVDFVKELAKVNRGRAYFSSLSNLGDYIFMDYIRNRRRNLR